MKRFLLSIFCVGLAAFTLSGCTNPFRYAQKSGIQVITGETPASVFLNGQYLNKTPLVEKSLSAGIYTIRIEPDASDLVPYETTVHLYPGSLTVLTWKAASRPELSSGVLLEMEKTEDGSTSVAIETIPENAITTLDGDKQFSPITRTDVTEGTHELQLTLPSYETQKHTISVQKGFALKVSAKLARLTTEVESAQQVVVSDTPAETATASAEVATAATPSASPLTTEKSEAQTATVSGHVKIIKTGFFQNEKEVLRVRDFPGATGKELGFAPVGNVYPYLGQQKNSWYFIDFSGKQGWVSSQFSQLVP